MSHVKKKLAALATVAVATPLLVVAAAGTSGAASSVTWSTGGKCLAYGINTTDTNLSSTDNVVATGEYLNTNSDNNAVTSTTKQAWH